MTELLRDIRHSFRLIRRHPGHALAIVMTLAVAIGVGTVVIALVDQIVLRPLPFSGSERVVRIHEVRPDGEKAWGASFPNIRDWAAASKSLDALALARNWSYTMETPSGSVSIDAAIATPQWFTIHSIRPVIGRFFHDDELRKGSNHVVVLSNEMWRTQFNSDPQILQRPIRLQGEPYQIVGVLPEHPWIYQFDDAKMWLPLSAIQDDIEDRKWRGFVALGRLAPGASLESARQELSSIQQRLGKTYPATNAGFGVDVNLLRTEVAGSARKMLLVFLGSVISILLIACANIANLSLAFNSWRTREFALRYAVGAGRGSIARQILIESMVLAIIGGALGLAIANGGLTVFRAVAPDDIPRLDEVTIDGRIVAITVFVSIVSALLFGLFPARAAARSGSVNTGRSATAPGTHLRRMLVIGELALAFVLVTATGLMTRAFTKLLEWNPGFDTQGVTITWAVAKSGTSADAIETFDRAARDMETIPGVRAVAQTSGGPLFGGNDGGDVRIVGRNGALSAKWAQDWFDVSPNYFRTLGVPLLRGREFRDADREGTPRVAIINEAMAHRYWGDADPLGARIQLDDQPWQIVGIVRDVPPFRPDQSPAPELYLPQRQMRRLGTFFVVRSSLAAGVLERYASEIVKKQEPVVSLNTFRQYDEIAARKRIAPRFSVIVISILSVLAFALAAIGIYGLVSFSVVSRAREIAIRLAVGADPKRVVREIVIDSGKLLIAGVLIGVTAAVALARFLVAFLFGLSPFDPLTWLGMSIAFACVVLVACTVPALRAANIDPAASLRVE